MAAFLAALGPLLGGLKTVGAAGLAGAKAAPGLLKGLGSKILPGIGSSEIAEGASQGNMFDDVMNFGKAHPKLSKGLLAGLGGGLMKEFGSEEEYNMYLQQLLNSIANNAPKIGSDELPGTTNL